MNVWEIAILKTIDSLGGEASLQEIYERIRGFIKLTKEHLRPLESAGGRPAYPNQVRRHVNNLKKAGELIQVSRGCYSITKKGLKRIGVF